MREIIIEFIKEILKDNDSFDQDVFTDLKDNANLRDDLGLTSFDLAALTVMIEDEYDVDVFENQLVFTLGEIIQVIKDNS